MTDGTIEPTPEGFLLRFERHLAHPVGMVWTALTDPPSAAVWFGGDVEIDLRVGGHYITHHQSGDVVTDRILRLEPPHLLEHTFWEHLNPDASVTYQLSEEGDGCCLVLTHRLSRADLQRAARQYGWDDPTGSVPRSAAGWHRLLDRLESSLDGRDVDRPAPPEELMAIYQRQMG